MIQPTLHPVTLKVFEAPLMVTVRRSHLRQCRDGDVISIEADMLVDLIGNRDCIVPNAQLGDGLQLRSVQDSACRITGSVDDDGSGSIRERGRQALEVEWPTRLERDVHRFGVGQNGVRPVVFIEGLEHNDFIAGIHQGQQNGNHRFGCAAGHRDFPVRICVQSVPLAVFPGQCFAQPLSTPGDRVLVDVVLNRLPRRFLQQLRRRKVGKPLGQIDGPVFPRESGHPPDY